MGAFILFKSDILLDIEAADRVFLEKGFSRPKQFALNNFILWLYPKQLIEDDNYVQSQNGISLFATGTLIYKGLSYKNSLLSLLEDYSKSEIHYEDLTGAFCIIFFNKGEISILNDRANIYHIFVNKDQTVLSSSFLALIAVHKNKLLLDKLACLEQLLIGYVTGPETSVKNIYMVNRFYINRTKSDNLSFYSWSEILSAGQNCGFSIYDCVDEQLTILKYYFRSIASLSSSYGVDIGLSGGYDSRLNLLLSVGLPVPISAHTHDSAEHNEERKIAELLAKSRDIHLNIVPDHDSVNISQNKLIENLTDSLYFYDGRTNLTMGTFNYIYTRKYRVAILGKSRLGLNGLGGELYRNFDYTRYSHINLIEWIKYHIMEPSTVHAFSDESDLNNLIDYMIMKYSRILGISVTDTIDLYMARKLYAEVWLPYSAGIKSHAENQLAFFLMPFTEYRISHNALKATPFIGRSGKFQTLMIKTLDENMARIPSTYGFSFDKEPLGHTLKSCVRCYIPDRMKNILGYWKIQLRRRKSYNYTSLLEKHDILRQIFSLLVDIKLPVNLERLLIHKSHFERSMAIGYFLLKFNNKISWDD